MRALVVVGLLLSSGAASAQGTPSYVGRWYTRDTSECTGQGHRAQGVLIYTAKETRAMEGRCRIESTKPKGAAVEMLLKCRAEGETSTERETVSVSGNKLKRQVTVAGKPVTF